MDGSTQEGAEAPAEVCHEWLYPFCPFHVIGLFDRLDHDHCVLSSNFTPCLTDVDREVAAFVPEIVQLQSEPK